MIMSNSVLWGLVGLFALVACGGEVVVLATPEPIATPTSTAIPTLVPEPTLTVDERIRQSILSHEFSHGIEVDDSMSDELLEALYFLERYLNRPHRENVAPDDLHEWCMSAVTPMTYYSQAPDQQKARIIVRERGRIEEQILRCLQDPVYRNKEVLVATYYPAFHAWFEYQGVSPAILLALHHLGVVSIAQEDTHIMAEITDWCMSLEPRFFKRCLAERLIDEVPALYGYQYGLVRGYMD